MKLGWTRSTTKGLVVVTNKGAEDLWIGSKPKGLAVFTNKGDWPCNEWVITDKWARKTKLNFS